jgi:nucleotidyltransferase substrate binding protein (TIGR01987 family)
MSKLESLIKNFDNALKRFEAILGEEKTDIVRDSAIKRFEIVFDLAWKTTKAFLEKEHNIVCASPRNCLKEAFRLGLIEYDDYWFTLIDDRNYTAHAYSEALADKIYSDLPQALVFFQKLAGVIAEAKQ